MLDPFPLPPDRDGAGGTGAAPTVPAAEFPPVMSHKQLAELWDIVIRTHYLAHELGDACAASPLASARMALSLSEVLSCWARMFGEELETLEKKFEKDKA